MCAFYKTKIKNPLFKGFSFNKFRFRSETGLFPIYKAFRYFKCGHFKYKIS